MEPGKIAKQMISFQKTLFENSFKAMTLVMDQTEQMVSSFLNQMPWLPEEGKKTITDAIKLYKKSRDDYKKAVDDGFIKMEEMFTPKSL